MTCKSFFHGSSSWTSACLLPRKCVCLPDTVWLTQSLNFGRCLVNSGKHIAEHIRHARAGRLGYLCNRRIYIGPYQLILQYQWHEKRTNAVLDNFESIYRVIIIARYLRSSKLHVWFESFWLQQWWFAIRIQCEHPDMIRRSFAFILTTRGLDEAPYQPTSSGQFESSVEWRADRSSVQ